MRYPGKVAWMGTVECGSCENSVSGYTPQFQPLNRYVTELALAKGWGKNGHVWLCKECYDGRNEKLTRLVKK